MRPDKVEKIAFDIKFRCEIPSDDPEQLGKPLDKVLSWLRTIQPRVSCFFPAPFLGNILAREAPLES